MSKYNNATPTDDRVFDAVWIFIAGAMLIPIEAVVIGDWSGSVKAALAGTLLYISLLWWAVTQRLRQISGEAPTEGPTSLGSLSIRAAWAISALSHGLIALAFVAHSDPTLPMFDAAHPFIALAPIGVWLFAVSHWARP